MLILLTLGTGPTRYFELRNRIEGASEKMLAQTQRSLARDGLISRHEAPTVPPQVTYALTSLGERFRAPLAELRDVIAATLSDVGEARRDWITTCQ